MTPVAEHRGLTPDRIAEVIASDTPAVLRGLAADWPAVRAANQSAYLRALDSGAGCDMAFGPPEIEGRLGYAPGLTGLAFTRHPATVAAVIDRLVAEADAPRPHAIAAQAVPAATHLPGFMGENSLPCLAPDITPRLWIGNRIVVATHHDMMRNIAVVVAGRRRFTLFPPTQTANLYLGPIEFTPAGTPVSLADPEAPDYERFPRFAEAMAQASQAELSPGDAIYIPFLWWHHVRSLDPFSVLANYWWNEVPQPQPGLAPMDVLMHALLAFPQLPEEQRRSWQALFDHLVFDGEPEHVPEGRRGIRGKVPDEARVRLRRQLGQIMQA